MSTSDPHDKTVKGTGISLETALANTPHHHPQPVSSGVSLKSIMVILVVIGGVFAAGNILMPPREAPLSALENLELTTSTFEHWSVEHPDQMQRIINEGIDYKELSVMVTGKEANYRLLNSAVEYLPQDGGHYDLCIDRKGTYETIPYRYSSATNTLEEDVTCDL